MDFSYFMILTGKGYTFKGDVSNLFLPPSEKRSNNKRESDSFLLVSTPFRKRLVYRKANRKSQKLCPLSEMVDIHSP